MTDSIESITAVSGSLPDPPDGYGTQLPFASLPSYMQNMLRKQWNDLAAAEQECVRKNLEDWQKAERRADFSGPLTVGPIPAGADSASKRRSSKNSSPNGHQAYGDFSTTITEDPDV